MRRISKDKDKDTDKKDKETHLGFSGQTRRPALAKLFLLIRMMQKFLKRMRRMMTMMMVMILQRMGRMEVFLEALPCIVAMDTN